MSIPSLPYVDDSRVLTFFCHESPIDIALKAESAPPLWWRDAVYLETLLRTTWAGVSRDYFKRIDKAFLALDLDTVEAMLDEGQDLGKGLVKRLGVAPKAIISNLQTKAHHFWALYGKELGIDTGVALKRDYSDRYQKKLVDAVDKQVAAFLGAYPERQLHPEIRRQLDYLQTSQQTSALDVVRVRERLEMLHKRDDKYWENVSSTHVARVWHADGVLLAEQNGVATLRGVGPQDQKTCPVCMHLLGIEIPVKAAADKIRKGLEIKDPDEYKAFFKFPRFDDVDNRSPEERLASVGPLPFPAHCRCRHGYRWATMAPGWREQATSLREPKPIPEAKPNKLPDGFRRENGYVAFTYPGELTEEGLKAWCISHFPNADIVFDDIVFANRTTEHLRLVAEHIKLPHLEFLEIGNTGNYAEEANTLGMRYPHSVCVNKQCSTKKNPLISIKNEKTILRNTLEIDEKDLKVSRKKYKTKSTPELREHISQLESSVRLKERKLEQMKDVDEGAHIRQRILSDVVSSYDRTSSGVLMHEIGHQWHGENHDMVLKELGMHSLGGGGRITLSSAFYKYRVSVYSLTNDAEIFAENFALYWLGEIDKMHADMVIFFDKHFPNAALGKALMPEIYGV